MMQGDQAAADRIRQHWDDRASKRSGQLVVTTEDVHMRELEIKVIIATLDALGVMGAASVLDLGCGDGYSTLQMAKRFKDWSFLGVDYSENMVKAALRGLSDILEPMEPDVNHRVSFMLGDAQQLEAILKECQFDVILTERCLINLPSLDDQRAAIWEIAHRTRAGGFYLAVENFLEGHEAMNAARAAVGLPCIPVRWHNLYFHRREFLAAASRNFYLASESDFASSYYFATRVVYAKMCQMRGEEPDYDHDIHKLAVDLPAFGNFCPTRMIVLRRKSLEREWDDSVLNGFEV